MKRGGNFISDKWKNNKLLGTILIPQDLDALKKHLPKPNYEDY